ncbi:hypothetical protein HanHA89_Chr12g0467541 [Helianthus annuus]|nr:hypothetical protein HanHA89_Chr12g0467541 [Helianthus annuus]
MPPRSMAFLIFNSIQPVQEFIPVSSSMKMFNLWLSLDWWEEINESRNWKIGKFCTNWPHSSLLTFVDSLKEDEGDWTQEMKLGVENKTPPGKMSGVVGHYWAKKRPLFLPLRMVIKDYKEKCRESGLKTTA